MTVYIGGVTHIGVRLAILRFSIKAGQLSSNTTRQLIKTFSPPANIRTSVLKSIFSSVVSACKILAGELD
jgi:hypothetical protein